MLALVFDTETTGKAAFNQPSISPAQPDLVQLGALLIDLDTGAEYGILDVIVYPASWTISQEVAMIHGISHGLAERVGINLDSAVNIFLDMLNAADVVVAHNMSFDRLVMERAIARVDLAYGREVGESPFEGKELFCTMKASTDIVKAKSKRPMHAEDYKWPKLIEAMKFFFDEGLDGAHNAMVDCRACARVLVELINRNDGTLPEYTP